MAQHASTRLDGAIGVQEILDAIPADARLLLIDHIKGLEAEAGTARSLASRTAALRAEEAATTLMMISDLRRERDALRFRVDDLQSHLARRVSAGVLARARKLLR